MGVRCLLIFALIICCVFGVVQSQFFAQSFGGTGAASSGSSVSTSNSGSFSNSAISSSSSSASSSGNAAISSSNSALATGNSATAAAGAGAFTSYHDPEQTDPSLPEPNVSEPEDPEVPKPKPEVSEPEVPEGGSPVDQLAHSVSYALRNSPVLGNYTQFELYQPYDLIVRITHRFLLSAGISDPSLEEVVGQAILDVGWLDTQLFFDVIGYLEAYFIDLKKLLTNENVEYFTLRLAASVDLAACEKGVYDTETMINAVILGFFKVLDSYGFITYEDSAELVYSFAELLRALSNTK